MTGGREKEAVAIDSVQDIKVTGRELASRKR
jgi:hypothetical protein